MGGWGVYTFKDLIMTFIMLYIDASMTELSLYCDYLNWWADFIYE